MYEKIFRTFEKKLTKFSNKLQKLWEFLEKFSEQILFKILEIGT